MERLEALELLATPANLIGLPVTCRTESAAPPRASPSSLVRITPVSGRRSLNARATLTASWPCIASTMNRVSTGLSSVQLGDLAHHLLVDRQAARGVDDEHVHVMRARVVERRGCDVGLLFAEEGTKRRARLAGHGLQLRLPPATSAETTRPSSVVDQNARACRWWSCPSPAVRPSGSPRAAGWRGSRPTFASPISLVSSRCTTPTSAWPGVRLPTLPRRARRRAPTR